MAPLLIGSRHFRNVVAMLLAQSMIRKSAKRFSENIMLNQKAKARLIAL
ncbi:hypothetical protein [Bradyrhizobium sp. USDA 3364]